MLLAQFLDFSFIHLKSGLLGRHRKINHIFELHFNLVASNAAINPGSQGAGDQDTCRCRSRARNDRFCSPTLNLVVDQRPKLTDVWNGELVHGSRQHSSLRNQPKVSVPMSQNR